MSFTFFITFRTYGSWIHGSREGTVDKDHNQFGTPHVAPDPHRAALAQRSLTAPPVTLSPVQRSTAAEAIADLCTRHRWTLWALNIRTNHVHLVLSCHRHWQTPERIMVACKAAATTELRRRGLFAQDTRIWARHASTRHIDSNVSFAAACHYVLHQQAPSDEQEREWTRRWVDEVAALRSERAASSPPVTHGKRP